MKEKQPQAEVTQERERVWNEFMHKTRDLDEICEIACDRKHPLRMRALEVCLAPDINDLPYSVNLEKSMISFNLTWKMSREQMDRIAASKENVAFLIDKLPKYIENVDKKIEWERDKSRRFDWIEIRTSYNNLIPVLLKHVSVPEGVELFKYFTVANVNLPVESFIFINYIPLENLLKDKNIKDMWKFEAANKMATDLKYRLDNLKWPHNDFSVYCELYSEILSSVDLPKGYFDMAISTMIDLGQEKQVIPFSKIKSVYSKLENPITKCKFVKNHFSHYYIGSNWLFDTSDEKLVKSMLRDVGNDQYYREKIETIWENSQRKKKLERTNLEESQNRDMRKKILDRDLKRRMKN